MSAAGRGSHAPARRHHARRARGVERMTHALPALINALARPAGVLHNLFHVHDPLTTTSPTNMSPTTAAPAYPPAAHTTAGPVATQPTAAPTMSLAPESDDARASRLRGGCFPLPVRAGALSGDRGGC
jgi:hypothetical protein